MERGGGEAGNGTPNGDCELSRFAINRLERATFAWLGGCKANL